MVKAVHLHFSCLYRYKTEAQSVVEQTFISQFNACYLELPIQDCHDY